MRESWIGGEREEVCTLEGERKVPELRVVCVGISSHPAAGSGVGAVRPSRQNVNSCLKDGFSF